MNWIDAIKTYIKILNEIIQPLSSLGANSISVWDTLHSRQLSFFTKNCYNKLHQQLIIYVEIYLKAHKILHKYIYQKST